jgi:hypothetical protein
MRPTRYRMVRCDTTTMRSIERRKPRLCGVEVGEWIVRRRMASLSSKAQTKSQAEIFSFEPEGRRFLRCTARFGFRRSATHPRRRSHQGQMPGGENGPSAYPV